jgi:hypothetical protein
MVRFLLVPLLMASILAAGCSDGADESAEVVLANAQTASRDVKSFHMTMSFTPPILGSTGISSTSLIWQQPDLALLTAVGEGTPEFQQVFRRGSECFVRLEAGAAWNQVGSESLECAQELGGFQLEAFLDMLSPELVENSTGASNDLVTVWGIAKLQEAVSSPASAGTNTWLLEIDKSDHLLRRAEGFEGGGDTPRVVVDITDHNADLEPEISRLIAPAPN